MTAMPHVKPFEVTPEMMKEIDSEVDKALHATNGLLTERGTTHGDFGENAYISQTLKHLFRECAGWDIMTVVEREAMDMIALKFSRILSGKPHERQHWEDVVGYAKLALDRCPG